MLETNQFLVPIDFNSTMTIFSTMESNGCRQRFWVSHILQNIFFYVQQKKENHLVTL